MSSHTVESFTLPGASMGNTRALTIHRYGDRSHPAKAYLQAGLHADEAPGFLVMHHLMDRLDRADARGAIVGEIVLVPVANPIGVSQWRDDGLQGRFDFWNGINFNRRFPDLADQVAEHVKDTLGDGPEDNIRLIREATGKVLKTLRAENEAGHLKQNLLTLAYDADIVLDLHCDYQAVLHIYMGESLWPRDRDLPAQLGARTTLLADDSGVTPFDEACSRIWFQLAARFPQHPIPPSCLAATVELRGLADLDHETAGRDADNIMAFLTRRGLLQGTVPELPELPRDPTPLSGVEHLKAPGPGVVVFLKKPGDGVAAGEVVAEVINPLEAAPDARVRPVRATTDGMVFARSADRFARPGRILAKIAGKKALQKAGANLLTL
jgi:predicted deacylase